MLKNRIKELRKKKGWTQAELAKKLKVSQQTIGSWEVGRAEPSGEFLTSLSEIFNVSVDYLLGTTDVPTYNGTPIDLKDALDVVFSYDGKPLTDEDKEFLKAFLEGRKSKD